MTDYYALGFNETAQDHGLDLSGIYKEGSPATSIVKLLSRLPAKPLLSAGRGMPGFTVANMRRPGTTIAERLRAAGLYRTRPEAEAKKYLEGLGSRGTDFGRTGFGGTTFTDLTR